MESDANKKHPLDWNAKIVRFFYDNSRLVWLIIIAALIGGTFSLMSFRREGFPAVSIKTVIVQTIYPGANSKEVESKVTKEVESAIKDAKGVKDFSSISQNSYSQVIVNFEESVDLDQAVSDLQNKLVIAKGSLPEDVEQPKVMTITTSGAAFVYGIADGKGVNSSRIEAKKMADEIESVDGVKKASQKDVKENVVVSVDSASLRKAGIPLSNIAQIVQAGNVDLPTGYLEIDGKKQSSIALGSISSLSDIENILIGVNPLTKAPVLLKDVAKVDKELAVSDNIDRFGVLKDGNVVSNEGVLLEVELTSDADIIRTKEKIDSAIADAKSEGKVDGGVVATTVYDMAKQTEDQVKEIMDASVGSKKNLFLLGGLQLLFLAMLLLVNWRAALISTLSIPFAFALTFISLKLTGTQLNTIVLFSFVLVLGLIVDPAIVMIEAIQRYRDLKYSSRNSVIESGRRYGASIMMAVLTSLLVFLPFGVVTGYFGQIIKYLPLTVIPALVASYIVPIALLPYLTRKILHREKGNKESAVFSEEENLSKASHFIMKLNTWILSNIWHKVTILAVSIVLIVLSFSLVATGKIQIVQFANPSDSPMLQAQATYQNGLTETQKNEAAKKIEDALIKEEGIKEYFFTNQSADGFWMYINLKDKSERKDKNNKSKEILARVIDNTKNITGLDDLLFAEVITGPPSGGYQIKTQLATNDLAKLENASKRVGEFLQSAEHVTKVDDGFTGKTDPEIQISLNRTKVGIAGLSSFEVGSQIKSVIDQNQIGKFSDKDGNNFDIFLTANSKPKNIDELKKLPLLSRAGTIINLGDVADVTEGQGVGSIERYNGARFATVQARVDDTKNTATVQKTLDDYLTKDKLKELGIDSKLNKGDIGDITKSFTDLGVALIIAIVLTYLVLVLQFRSFSLPVIMLFTIPLSFIGVFPVLWITKSQFGFLELLGITILVGIVENVAIFLIDYANQLVKEKGLTPKEAIIKASGVRFRPILLTKLVALGGLLPLAIESEFWRGLSLVIIAGIGLSGFFSLVVIPILYVSIMKLRARVHKEQVV